MNRIILIGNGFDLAHGMKTSYDDFLDDFWKNTIQEIQKSKVNEIFENEELIIDKIYPTWTSASDNKVQQLIENIKKVGGTLKFKNKFLEKITLKKDIENWVDIENEYYDLLKESFNNKTTGEISYNISQLNKDFNRIKVLLEEYLLKTEQEFDKTFNDVRIKRHIGEKIYAPLESKDFTEEYINYKVELEYKKISGEINSLKDNLVSFDELSSENRVLIGQLYIDETEKNIKKQIKEILVSEDAINYFKMAPIETLFLNFNYTFNDLLYSEPNKYNKHRFKKITEAKFIHIHGSLIKSDNNPVIFGFGDEIDQDYNSIEKLNDNRYLENIKSIKYLETDNYKKLLEFINSDYYQIFIFGHSCGVSDRTLLNTLFEHQNCVSIKPFYYKKNENENNYSDIVRNISRNFNNKVDMRNKVVNKNYCKTIT